MKVTLQQVAEYANVSRRTVDRVINERGNVRPEVEQRVREALKVLDYQPNKLASALAYSKNQKTVCVIYQGDGFLDSDAGADVERGISDAIRELKDFGISVEVICENIYDPEEYAVKMEAMVKKGVSGFALRGPNVQVLRDKINELADRGIPVVTFNSDITRSKRAYFHGQDVYQSGRAAGNIMSKILRPGEKIIIECGIPDFYAHHLRVDGFVYEMKKNGFEEDQWIMLRSGEQVNSTYEQQYKTVYRGLKEIFANETGIRGIYMSVEPNRACGDFLRVNNMFEKPYVICHDSSKDNIAFLKEGIFDFIVDQNMYLQGFQSLITLKDILRNGTVKEQEYISDLVIFNSACIK